VVLLMKVGLSLFLKFKNAEKRSRKVVVSAVEDQRITESNRFCDGYDLPPLKRDILELRLKSYCLLRKLAVEACTAEMLENRVDHRIHATFLTVVLSQKCDDILLQSGVENGRSHFIVNELFQFDKTSL
jgi:hypothetical protein